MRSLGRSLLTVAAMTALTVGCTSWDARTTAPRGRQPVPVALGDPAPEIDGEDIDGKPFKLSDYRGKAVMLDFWGNW